MIPKIIHYSWFSEDPYPSHIEGFINKWKIILPDYEFVLWDAEKLRQVNHPFANEAYSVKKWAFAADLIRLYAVYHFGGIWLDTDIEIFKSFDVFLNDEMFIGKESWKTGAKGKQICYLTSHCFGAVAKHPFIGECLAYYNNRKFIINQDSALTQVEQYDMKMISQIQAEIALKYGLDWSGKNQDKKQVLTNKINVYPSYYFCRPQYKKLKDVYCIHRVVGGWRPNGKGYIKSLTDPQTMTLKIFVSRIWNRIRY